MATQPLLVSPSVLSTTCLNPPSRSIPRKQNHNSGLVNGSWEEESVARALQIQISSKLYIHYSIDSHIMPIKPRRSLSLLASVFQSSQSEYSNPSTAPSTAPSTPSSENRSFSSDSSVEITHISREPAYYDDLQSSNIDVLSVSSTAATVEETSLLDSDPFADLSAPPVASPLLPKERPSPSSTRPPNSPLSPTGSTSRSRSATLVSSPVRPAYQKRPIHSSPSLPSLSTLATANVNIPKKVRKGKVGARLPSEPWDIVSSPESEMPVLPHSSEDEEDYGKLCSRLSVVDEHSSPGDGLSDDLEFADVEGKFSPKPSSPIPIKSCNDEARMRSRSSSTSSGSSYSLEPTDWFSQIGHTSADFNVHSSPITSLPSSQTSMTDRYSLSCSSSSSGSDHSDHYLDPMDISHPYSHEYPLLSLPKFSLSLELPTYHSTEQLGEEEFSALRSSPCQAARERIHSPYHEETINMNALHVSDPLDEMAQFEPGSSASTIRASPLKNNPHIARTQKPTRSQSRRRRGALTAEMWIKGSNTGLYEEPAIDGGDYARGRSTSANGLSSGNAGGGGYSGRAYSTGGRSVNGSVGGFGSGGHGGDDGDDGNKRNRRFMPGSFAAFSNESDEDGGDESADEDDYGLPSGLPPRNRSRSDDDDVPLARSIPTALKAQQSIRMKDREARDKRRKEREARAIARSQQRLQQQAATTSSPPLSSSHDAPKSLRRPLESTSQTPPSPFPIDDLTKRLENVQTRGRPDSRSTPLSVGGAAGSEFVSPKDGPSAAPARTLRPMRSFHKPEPKKAKDDLNAHPLPTGAEAKLTRSTTRARARSTASREDHSGNNTFQVHTVPIPAPPDEPTTAKLERKRTVKTTADGTRSARTSTEHSRPPLPGPADVIARQNHAKATLTQQRIFIGDRQRFVVVEISHSTTAGDVVRMVEAQGALKEWRGTGGWMLFEIAQDFGMERPIRSFELLADIEASWNKDKLVNTFLLKLTSLASILSRSALPSSSPTHSGYIEWESKRGKWNKRYLMLKEHSLWLSKRDNGRDEIMLCSLSNFDAYQITRLVKAPKEFTFAVKSTDNLSFFENTADYLHIFSCKKDAGEKWMEKILLARSYILHQERNILSKASSKGHPKSLPPPQTGSTGLSRSLTKRAGPTLVNVNPANVFEPGSLLRG